MYQTGYQRRICWTHGAKLTSKKKRKTCSNEGCTNQVINEGVCLRHGANVKRKTCAVKKDSTNQIVKGGVCCKHGAKVKNGYCCN